MLKRIIKIVVALVAIVLLVAALWAWRSNAQLESEIRRIRDSGDPVSIADLEPKEVLPDKNDVTYLSRVSEDARSLYNEIHPYAHSDDFSWRQGLSESQREKVKAGFDAYPRVMEMIDRASQCSDHAWPLDYALAPPQFTEALIQSVQDSKNFARICDCYARLQVASGDPDGAAQTFLQSLRLDRLHDREPMVLGALVSLACRAIALHGLNGIMQTSKLKPETHASIETELARHSPLASFAGCIKSERAFGIDSFRELSSTFGMLTGQWNSYLEMMNEEIQVGSKAHFETKNLRSSNFSSLTQMGKDALDAGRESANRSEALVRCLRILNAIHSHPEFKAESDFGLLNLPKEVGIDPYSGKSLLIRSTAAGWLVYSVGRDETDSGGSISDLKDIGLAPPL